MDINEFYKQNLTDTREKAELNGRSPEEIFIEDSLEDLEEMGEISDPNVRYFGQRGPNQAMMKIDGYSFDSSDRSLILFQVDFHNTDDVQTLIRTDLDNKYKQMLNFLQACSRGVLENYCDASNEYVQDSKDIKRRLGIVLVNDGEDESIEKIRLVVITNAILSNRIKVLEMDPFLNRRVELSVWSLERFYDLYSKGLEKEDIVIDVKDYGIPGIPCIKAQMSEGVDYDAYLAIVPGRVLSDIYYRYGSRLLEGNVRSFLSTKNKINKNIRRTILTEPTKFFTYNNGIATTADGVDFAETDQGLLITGFSNLQIINGGQTTASLTSAFVKDDSKLENIFVPMKLTVVKDHENYDDMVQNISKYANSQNKVTDADFFSNHPFHRQMEKLSRTVLAPAVHGSVVTTRWYYERSRGKYNQEQFKMKDKSREKNEFLAKNPKNQVIKKEELGKYLNSLWMKPATVAKGASKNMKEYAQTIDEMWAKDSANINESFFKMAVCATIFFRETDKMVGNAPWYKTGGYKSQVIPYTIAKIMSVVPKGYEIDWGRIWRSQELYNSLRKEIEIVSKMANDFIQDSHGMLPSEYAKREAAWTGFKALDYQPTKEFLNDLISKDIIASQNKAALKNQQMANAVNIETEIFNLGGPYWRKLLAEGQARKILTPKDESLLSIVCTIDTPRPKFPTPSQCKAIWKIRNWLGQNGVLI